MRYNKALLYLYRICSHISRQFWLNSDVQVVGVGLLYAGHATQPESTVSMTAICQWHSLCVCRSRRGPLVGQQGYVNAWGRTRRRGSEWSRKDLCCCCCCIASHCNLTPFQHSDCARPSFSDEIEDDDDSTHPSITQTTKVTTSTTTALN